MTTDTVNVVKKINDYQEPPPGTRIVGAESEVLTLALDDGLTVDIRDLGTMTKADINAVEANVDKLIADLRKADIQSNPLGVDNAQHQAFQQKITDAQEFKVTLQTQYDAVQAEIQSNQELAKLNGEIYQEALKNILAQNDKIKQANGIYQTETIKLLGTPEAAVITRTDAENLAGNTEGQLAFGADYDKISTVLSVRTGGTTKYYLVNGIQTYPTGKYVTPPGTPVEITKEQLMKDYETVAYTSTSSFLAGKMPAHEIVNVYNPQTTDFSTTSVADVITDDSNNNYVLTTTTDNKQIYARMSTITYNKDEDGKTITSKIVNVYDPSFHKMVDTGVSITKYVPPKQQPLLPIPPPPQIPAQVIAPLTKSFPKVTADIPIINYLAVDNNKNCLPGAPNCPDTTRNLKLYSELQTQDWIVNPYKSVHYDGLCVPAILYNLEKEKQLRCKDLSCVLIVPNGN